MKLVMLKHFIPHHKSWFNKKTQRTREREHYCTSQKQNKALVFIHSLFEFRITLKILLNVPAFGLEDSSNHTLELIDLSSEPGVLVQTLVISQFDLSNA